MSFLLEGKPRRRNRLPTRAIVPPRSRNFSKDAATSNSGGTTMTSGGQVQIQRPQVHQPQRVIPQQQQQQHDQHKQEAMQSVGISMEQVMEDLRVLEEQQRDSQRKLAQVKAVKQNRLERRTVLESQLAALKYKNGEHRAQLNRASEVLSKSTREMEAVKLEASSKDERLKALDNKLKKALTKSREHQTYRRKIDARFVNIRSKESVCHRLLCALRGDVKVATENLDDAKNREQQLRHASARINSKTNEVSEDTSKVRAEVSGIAEDLRSAKQMQASTKLRAESIAAEIDAEDNHQNKESNAMKARLLAAQANKTTVRSGREKMEIELKLKHSKMHELWQEVVTIQKKERHDPSPEPTEGGACPYLDVDSILKSVREEEQQLASDAHTMKALRANRDRQNEVTQQLEAEYDMLISESNAIRGASKKAHSVELERTMQYEKFLADLEQEREEAATLRTSLVALEADGKHHKECSEGKLKVQSEVITDKQAVLDGLKLSTAQKKEALTKSKELLDSENSQSAVGIEKTKQEAEIAKANFEKAKRDVEFSRNFRDTELDQEIEEIERAQSIMAESTKEKIARLLKNDPELKRLQYQYDAQKSSEERIADALIDFKIDCKQHMDELNAKQLQILADIAQGRETEQRRIKQATELERQAKEQADSERKEKRRRVREDKRRKKAEQEEAEEKRSAKEEGDRVARLEHESRVRDHKRRKVSEEERRAKAQEKRAARLERDRAEKETADAILGVEAASDSPKEANGGVSSALEDEMVSENKGDGDANEFDDGCFTQRVGLDVPTPKSKQSTEQQRRGTTQSRQPKEVRWEGLNSRVAFKSPAAIQNETTEEPSSRRIRPVGEPTLVGDNHEKPQDRRKAYGSIPQNKKERGRKEKDLRRKRRASSTSSLVESSGSKTRKSLDSTLFSKPQASQASSNKTNRTRPTASQKSKSTSIKSSAVGQAQERMTDLNDLRNTDKKHSSISPRSRDSQFSKVSRGVSSKKQPSKSSLETTTKKSIALPEDRSKGSKRSSLEKAFEPAKKKLKIPASSMSRIEKRGVSDRSATCRKSTSSRKATSSRTKKRANEETGLTKTSGISSGERGPSKSRRRKSKGAESKSRSSGGVLGQMTDDFNFNF